MKLSPFLLTAMIVAPPAMASAQAASPLPSDGLALLEKAALRYAEAKSYSIQSTEERTISSELYRQWTRQIINASEAPGGRFHFEGRTQFGDAAEISDGKTIWTLHADQHRYTMISAPEPAPGKGKPIPNSEMGLYRAKYLRRNLGSEAERFKSARQLADAVVAINGRSRTCAVVSMRESDLKRMTGDESFAEIVWIDKRTQTIVKVVEHSSLRMGGVPAQMEVTTIYPRAILDGALPEGLFTFSPPADSHEVKEFPSAMEEATGATLIGDRVPSLKLKAADGTVTPIESFRGKTVLIDLWATWCAPCVAELPTMAKLAEEGKDKGLVLIAIDYDEDANKAAGYLREKHLNLTDFHDGDGRIQALLGPSPLPRDLVVDKDGWVVGDGPWVDRHGDFDENQLRARLAALDPALKDLAPKAPQQPAQGVATK
jgi:thiol-disulfide isomerase/thioredoxin